MTAAIRVSNLFFKYEENIKDTLADISLLVEQGERIAILGDNGAGKSTFLKLLVGLLLPTRGTINVLGNQLNNDNLKLIRSECGFLFQNSDDQILLPRVWEEVGLCLAARKLAPLEINAKVKEVLKLVGIGHLAERVVHRLSGGEKRLVTLAGALVHDPKILLLDEPTASLDAKARLNFIDLINTLSTTMVLVTHDLELASKLGARVIRFEKRNL